MTTSPGSYYSTPRTRQEQWAWLVQDAQRILRDPLSHRPEEVSWARDMAESEARKAAAVSKFVNECKGATAPGERQI